MTVPGHPVLAVERPHHNSAAVEEIRPFHQPGLYRSAAAPLLMSLYKVRRFRPTVYSLAGRLEGGRMTSATMREILRRYHGVTVGAYSYGECLRRGALPAGVTIGRYASIADGVRVFLRNHPMDRLSMHPYFYNEKLGYVAEGTMGKGELFIGHDAWLGERALITPRCRRIGIGAVVGAGAVVTKDVEDFAVVAGNPAKFIRFRFDASVQRMILDSRWWERTVDQIRPFAEAMAMPITESCPWQHPFLSGA